MPRVFLIVLDSFGIGGAPDAAKYDDAGANTLAHICDRMKLRVPHMATLGLGLAAQAASGRNPLPHAKLKGRWGCATEISRGKDTITGHWEIAGVPVPFDWHYYPKTEPAFPQSLLETIAARCNVPGFLALNHAAGTEVIEDFGVEHIKTGKPIMYTSVDSVIQFAAHESHFGLQRLYDLCKVARELTYDIKVGRIIARPFLGENPGEFQRTGNRKDFAIAPPSPTLLQILSEAGREVISVGKIGDIYGHVGTGEEIRISGNAAMMEKIIATLPRLQEGGFLMANFVDFDTLFGHRRDPLGYGKLLGEFDAALPRVFAAMQPGDRLILTADHGNDPTYKGTDHTRERTPILVWGPDIEPGGIGSRETFSDIGQSVAAHLGIGPLAAGTAFSL